jgi:hypothetical protein
MIIMTRTAGCKYIYAIKEKELQIHDQSEIRETKRHFVSFSGINHLILSIIRKCSSSFLTVSGQEGVGKERDGTKYKIVIRMDEGVYAQCKLIFSMIVLTLTHVLRHLQAYYAISCSDLK